MGSGVSAPDTRGPSTLASPVTVITSATATAMRSGKSQAGGGV